MDLVASADDFEHRANPDYLVYALAYVSLTVLPPFIGYHFPYISSEARSAYLDDYRQRLRTLDTQTLLAFPSMGDFDEKLRPRL